MLHRLNYFRIKTQNQAHCATVWNKGAPLRWIVFEKTVCCGVVYMEYSLREMFTQSLNTSIRQSIQNCYRHKKTPEVHPIILLGVHLLSLKEHYMTSETTSWYQSSFTLNANTCSLPTSQAKMSYRADTHRPCRLSKETAREQQIR